MEKYYLILFLFQIFISSLFCLPVYLSEEAIKLKNDESRKISFKSIENDNFELILKIKEDIIEKNKKTKSLFLFLIAEKENTEFVNRKLENITFSENFDGMCLKFRENEIIAIKNNGQTSISDSDFDSNKKTNHLRYKYNNINSYSKNGIIIKISKKNNIIVFEISNDGNTYDVFFIEELEIKQNQKIKLEFISNLIKGEISYIFWNPLTEKEKSKEEDKAINSETINLLYSKFEEISKYIASFEKYEEIAEKFTSHPFDTIIQEHNEQISKIKYLNSIFDSIISNNTNNNSKDLSSLLSIMRNASFNQESLNIIKTNVNEDIIASITQLEKNQKEMNESVHGLYSVITQSMNELNEKTKELDHYNLLKKITLIVLILSLIFLFLIYRNIEDISSNPSNLKKPKNEESKIELA